MALIFYSLTSDGLFEQGQPQLFKKIQNTSPPSSLSSLSHFLLYMLIPLPLLAAICYLSLAVELK